MRSRKAKKPIHIKLAIVGLLAAISYQAVGKPGGNDPLSKEWEVSLERNLDKLETSGSLDLKLSPWSDAPWSASSGGLLNRYKREDLAPEFRSRQRFLNIDDLKKLSPEERARQIELVSPIELFDLAGGFSSYPQTKKLRDLLARGRSAEFDEKMNFGWAAAATTLREPDAVRDFTVRIPPRVEAKITIGSSDVKGWMAYFYGVIAGKKVKIAKAGSRCQGEADPSCRRLDPATFHILLANLIRTNGHSFVADVDPSAAVKYRPIVGFESDIRKNAQGKLIVTTIVEYVRERAPQIEPYGFFNRDTDQETYQYSLVLDEKQNIVRGEWISATRPEFVWRVLSLPRVDQQGFGLLKDLYREAPLN